LIIEFGAAFASFFATLLAMTALRPVAVVVNLVDKPGGRKTHRGDIPIVGGVAMYLGTVFGLGLVPAGSMLSGASLLAAAALVVIVGLLDDRFEISPFARLPAHLAAAALAMMTSGLAVTSLGHPFGAAETVFSSWGSVAFTCVAIVGAINAFNMLDGMDGLAGTTAFIALTALAIVSFPIDRSLFGMTLVCGAAVAAFLVFNIPAKFNRRFRCFMGDAGSTLLGFLLACLCIGVSQGEGPRVSPTVAMWFVAIPLYELLSTTLRRTLRGRSPFQPDREHFHHKLLDAGFGVRGAFVVLIIIGVLLAVAGLVLHAANAPDFASFGLWLVCGAGTVTLMHNAQMLWHIFPERFRRNTQPAVKAP
jgi:UDP-GlcNAc:undecaprenyl-phosphate GlcNAc-1-phosphate transferase